KTGEIDGYSGFVFISKMNRQRLPIYANSVRKNLYRIVAQNEKREVQLPPISPHILRHTACTRMSESGMNLKVIQYLMGHHDMRTTVQVYDHADLERVSRESKKYDALRREKALAERIAT
ncbi:MAG: tyrosine-type recombinase/integrase, partial [Lachnospiraceae bacterium]|nr:tyrosine-type recombinase/integrase [Lachnospiraceae bacterium]